MNHSPTAFTAFAGRAADSYLSDGTTLDDAIAKIAHEKDLSRVQIQRVVELANHELNERLLKTAGDKTFQFRIASVDGVLGKLGTAPATGPSELMLRKAARAFVGVDHEPTIKIADITEHPDVAQTRALRAAQATEKIAGWIRTHRTGLAAEQAGLHEGIRDGLGKLAQVVKEHAARNGALADLHKFACTYDPASRRVWDVLFEAARDQVVKEAKLTPIGVRLANERLPKSAFLPGTTVINGNHKLLVHLDTLRNKVSAEDTCAQRIRLLDTFGPAVAVASQKFRGSADVSRYIAEELGKHAEAIADRAYCLDHVEKIAGVLATLGRTAARHPVATLVGAGVGAQVLNTASRAAAGGGRKITEGVRDWRPGAYRGVGEGAEV